MTLLAATFLSIGCSTTVESTTTPSSEDESAPEGSAAESEIDSPSFNAGPTTVRYGRHPGATYVREGQGGGGATNTGTSTTTTTVSTNASSYAYGDPITISFANMEGNSDDWISIAPVGTDNFYYSWWRYTKSATTSTMETKALDKLPPGTYVARAYFANGYDIQATSAQFTVTGTTETLSATVSTDKTSYTGVEPVKVSYENLQGTSTDWFGAYLPAGSMFSANGWMYTDGAATNNVGVDLWPLYKGTWEIRAFSNDTYDIKGKSATFTVTTGIKTDSVSGDSVTVTFGGMAGYYNDDFVAIATSTSLAHEYLSTQKHLLNVAAGGTHTFSGLPAGTYVARAFNHGDVDASATSASFIIQ